MAFGIDDLSAVVGHWSADALTGLSDGDPVDLLPSSVGSWDLVASGGERPLYRSAGINGLPSIEFDGIDDFMQSSVTENLSDSCLCSIAIVRLNTLKNFNTFGALTVNTVLPGNGNSRFLSFGYSNGLFLARILLPFTQIGAPLAANTNQILESIMSVRGIQLMVNGRGGDVTADSAPDDYTAGPVYASFGNCGLNDSALNGHLAEWILWHESTLAESFYIEGVLAHKYGIALPTSHPFAAAAPTSAPGTGSATFNPFRSRAFAG